jgi:cell division protein FtsQ
MAKKASAPGVNWLFWLRTVFWTILLASASVGARAVGRMALSDARFTLDRDAGVAASGTDFAILGLDHAPRENVMRIFRNDFGKNIFQIPIDERRRKLLAVDWIERASVSRIWPNRLVVRVWERKPVAFVNLTAPGGKGHNSQLSLIDAYGVILQRPDRLEFSAPILSGLNEQQTEAERQEHVRHYMRLMKELGPLAQQLSEVDVNDPGDLQISLKLEGRAIDLEVGDRNFKKRLQDFLDHYPEIHKRAPGAVFFDLRLDDRITSRE